jgi:hypothetical protein
VRPGRAWRLRGLALDGAARFAPHDTHLTVGMLSFTEQGSGLRVEKAAGRFVGTPDTGWVAEGVHLRTRDSELAGDGVLGPNVDLRLGVSRLAASELRTLLGRDAPTSDWRATLEARGPRSAVLVSGDVQADAADETGVRTVARARLHGTLDARAPIPIGDLATEFEHVDLAGVAEGRLPASDLSGRLELANDVATPRALRVALDLDGPRVAATTLTSLHATGRVADDDVQFRIIASSRDGSAQVTGSSHAAGPTIRRAGYGDRDRPCSAHGSTRADRTRQRHLAARGRGFSPATTKTTAALTLAPRAGRWRDDSERVGRRPRGGEDDS